ncbi:hypothetical protein [Acinetobacter nosocomialis]|uniref:hypothetical protein n=1 Tax=Acinetobacter nosocomialis TaxID=106654 RepID=UPI0024DEA669|nr:hypothetical protein [Acinetobacter nosocomialis]
MSEFKDVIFWDKQSTYVVTKEGKRLDDIKIQVSYGIKLNDLGDDFPIENHISPLCKSKDV